MYSPTKGQLIMKYKSCNGAKYSSNSQENFVYYRARARSLAVFTKWRAGDNRNNSGNCAKYQTQIPRSGI